MMRSALWLLLFMLPAGVHAQHIEARIGVFASTTLVRDDGASATLQRVLGSSTRVTSLRLAPAPMASVLVTTEMGVKTTLEAGLSAGYSQLRASNGTQEWNAQGTTTAGLSVGLRYRYWPRVSFTGGVGVTRFFSAKRGIFSEGSSLNPLAEAGTVIELPVPAPLHVAARVQTHTFGTPALRREGATDGKPLRFLLQLGVGR